MNNMNYKDFYFWLQGFLSNKKTLSESDLEVLRLMMLSVNNYESTTHIYQFDLKKQENPYQIKSETSWDNNNERGY